MTHEEAIKILEINSICSPKATEFKNAVEIAKNAIEKQIPKKVVPFKRTAHDFCNGVCEHSHYPCEYLKIYNNEYQYTDYKCPSCNKRVSDGEPYNCCHCGQALDWSDTR